MSYGIRLAASARELKIWCFNLTWYLVSRLPSQRWPFRTLPPHPSPSSRSPHSLPRFQPDGISSPFPTRWHPGGNSDATDLGRTGRAARGHPQGILRRRHGPWRHRRRSRRLVYRPARGREGERPREHRRFRIYLRIVRYIRLGNYPVCARLDLRVSETGAMWHAAGCEGARRRAVLAEQASRSMLSGLHRAQPRAHVPRPRNSVRTRALFITAQEAGRLATGRRPSPPPPPGQSVRCYFPPPLS